MELRHFRYFLAVAEFLSFVKAARSLHMSQPPLSKRISDMEEELGVRLFDRTSKRVELTRAGLALLPHARNAVNAFDAALRQAQSQSPNRSRRLRVALPPESSRTMFTELVNRLQSARIEVEPVEAYTADQQRLLLAGEIDVGVLRHPFDTRGLRLSRPVGQALGVILNANHPLAQYERIRMSDLVAYPLVQFERRCAPGLYDDLLRLCAAEGYIPRQIFHGIRITSTLLHTEQAVSLTTQRFLRRRGTDGTREIVWRPLEGDPIHWWTSAVCREDEYSSATKTAMEIVLSTLCEKEHWLSSQELVPGRDLHWSRWEDDACHSPLTV